MNDMIYLSPQEINKKALASAADHLQAAIKALQSASSVMLGYETNHYSLFGGSTGTVFSTATINNMETVGPLTLYYPGASVTVFVTNPYTDSELPLGKCLVSSMSLSTNSAVLGKGDTTKIGHTTYDDVEMLYEAPYDTSPDMLHYKVKPYFAGVISLDSLKEKIATNDEIDAFYIFENGILSEYRFEMPCLLYSGLQDNIFKEDLSKMSFGSIVEAMRTRDNILAQLRTAFSDAGLNVNINDSTGEIVVGDHVLFAIDSYTLTAEGQAFMDQLMKVYAAVIYDAALDGKVAGVVFEGHTDSSGSYEYNMVLSQNRADGVLQYCLDSANNGLTIEQRNVLKDLSFGIGYSYSGHRVCN